jgi:hypothetical protein
MLPVRACRRAWAQSHGVKVTDLEVTSYGMTELRIEGLDGNRLWVGQTKPDGT